MLLQLLQSASFFRNLIQIDKDLAEERRAERCLLCGGPLHLATYGREPWCVPKALLIADEFERFGLCCGHCRKRVLPASVLFLGRRIYVYPAILLVMFLAQGRRNGHTVRKLQKQVGVSVKTLERWAAYFREDFPRSAGWQRVRGRVSVGDGDLPGALLRLFFGTHGEGEVGLVACLCFLATGRAEVRDE